MLAIILFSKFKSPHTPHHTHWSLGHSISAANLLTTLAQQLVMTVDQVLRHELQYVRTSENWSWTPCEHPHNFDNFRGIAEPSAVVLPDRVETISAQSWNSQFARLFWIVVIDVDVLERLQQLVVRIWHV